MLTAGILSYNTERIGNFERNEAFSVELWMYGSIPRTSTLCSHMTDDSKHRGWLVYANGSRNSWNTLGFACISNETTNNFLHVITAIGQINFLKNTWHHIVFTYNGSSLISGVKCYVDGVIKSFTIVRDTLTDTIQDDLSSLQIGYAPVWSLFGGCIDEFVIYDRVLAPVEVLQRYNSGNGIETLFGSVYLQYKLNELSGTNVMDSSGKNRHGVGINNPSWVLGKLNNCIQLDGVSQKIIA